MDPNINSTPLTEYVIKPGSTFPLTLQNISENVAKKIETRLENNQTKGLGFMGNAIFPIIVREGIKCKEISEYIQQYKPLYCSNLEKLKTDAQWDKLSVEKRQEIYPQMQRNAISELPIATDSSEMIFEYDPLVENSVRFALNKYDSDVLETYLEYKNKKSAVFKVPPKSRPHLYKCFKRMAKLSLAEEVSPAGEFRLLPLPDTFTPDIIQIIKKALAYYRDVAYLISHTVSSAQYEEDRLSIWRDAVKTGVVKGWKVSCIDDHRTCKCCKQASQKIYPLGTMPKTPLHIACRCVVVPEM